MSKLVEINGCIEIPDDIKTDLVIDNFIEFVEKQGWEFGGDFRQLLMTGM